MMLYFYNEIIFSNNKEQTNDLKNPYKSQQHYIEQDQ